MIMTELIKINVREDGSKAVSARELHEVLESKRDFSNWIKDRIENYGLVENQDYVRFTKNVETTGGRLIEYALTLSAAKSLLVGCGVVFEKCTDSIRITNRNKKDRSTEYQTYIFHDKNNNAIKIGKTANILRRHKQIATSNPFAKLIAIRDDDIEKELHNKYKHLNIALEWFKADEKTVQEIIHQYKFKKV